MLGTEHEVHVVDLATELGGCCGRVGGVAGGEGAGRWGGQEVVEFLAGLGGLEDVGEKVRRAYAGVDGAGVEVATQLEVGRRHDGTGGVGGRRVGREMTIAGTEGGVMRFPRKELWGWVVLVGVQALFRWPGD